jgi:hyperosmotically inducible periplasmic protein
MRKTISSSFLAVTIALTGAAVQADQPQDAFITSKVKIELLTAEGVNPLDVNVDTVDRIVTLHGQVESAAAKEKAAAEARSVKGVVDVHNMLAVVPERAEKSVAASDDQLRERVKNVLDRDRALEDSRIQVSSVHDGIVVLSGKADTLSSHERALQDARSVDGVRRVASEIRSPDKLGDKELWNAHPTAEGAMNSASDTWVTTKVKMQLMTDPGLSPFSVNVDTHGGIVTLFGTVTSAQEKQAAEQQAKRVDGVKGVENALQVVPESAAERVAARDDQLEKTVQSQLHERASLKNDDIDVDVRGGVVRLKGTVDAFSDRMTAVTIASSTKGVKSVVDEIQIRNRG